MVCPRTIPSGPGVHIRCAAGAFLRIPGLGGQPRLTEELRVTWRRQLADGCLQSQYFS
jgi:hypothetical protein